MIEPRVADIILDQLGGHRFVVMTGSKYFLADNNSLRMTLTRNKSRANRLEITLEGNDTYTMSFLKYSPARMNRNTYKFTEDSICEIEKYTNVYADMLHSIFTSVTGLYTHL